MAFPLIPIIILAAVGGAVALVAKGSGPSSKTVVKHGVEYGPMCSTIKVVDVQAWTKYLQGKSGQLKSLEASLDPNSLAIDAVIKVGQIMLPGPGCNWSDPGFNTTIIDPTGGDPVQWLDIRAKLGDMSIYEAMNAGVFGMPGFGTGAADAKIGRALLVATLLAFKQILLPPLAPIPYVPDGEKWSDARQFYRVPNVPVYGTQYVLIVKEGKWYSWEVYEDAAMKIIYVEEGNPGDRESPWAWISRTQFDTADAALSDALATITLGTIL